MPGTISISNLCSFPIRIDVEMVIHSETERAGEIRLGGINEDYNGDSILVYPGKYRVVVTSSLIPVGSKSEVFTVDNSQYVSVGIRSNIIGYSFTIQYS